MNLHRILYIEDEADIRQIVAMSLESVGGFQVLACSTLRDALSEGPSFGPQLILLDYMLPGSDGGSAFRAIREVPEFRDVPVVFVTARVQPQEVEAYRRLGAAGVIPKPFDPMALPNLIGDLWTSSDSSSPALRGRLAALRPEYASELKSKVAQLESVRRDLRALHAMAHSIAGSAGTFGFHDAGRAAGELEAALKPLLDRTEAPRPEEQARIDALFDRLVKTVSA